MTKIAIVTDSIAHLPREVLHDLPVWVIPLYINWGGRSYLDDVDITTEQFYERLKVDRETPTTSMIPIGDFVHFYQSIIDQGYDNIISIHFAGNYSGICRSAQQAANMIDSERIIVIDSQSGSMGQGFQVLEVARAVKDGLAWEVCRKLAEESRNRSSIYFIPGSLEYLRRGGRISSLSALAGTILQYKPIITVRNGLMEVMSKVRTMQSAMEYLAQVIAREVKEGCNYSFAFLNSNAIHLARMMESLTYPKLGHIHILETLYTDISPTLGTHIGPNAVGVALARHG